MVWSDQTSFGHVTTATLTLSCLLEAGRYEDIFGLLLLQKTRMWHYEKYGAYALVRKGLDDKALMVGTVLLRSNKQTWGAQDIQRFCEDILTRQGKSEEAYQQFGLPSAAGNT
jgi:hypothetical protein